ncbi:hypothetical protein ACT7DO_01925 [Bacillus pacificus]
MKILRIFQGVDATVDWERNYVNGDLFRSVLGNITSSEEGLPKRKFRFLFSTRI